MFQQSKYRAKFYTYIRLLESSARAICLYVVAIKRVNIASSDKNFISKSEINTYEPTYNVFIYTAFRLK